MVKQINKIGTFHFLSAPSLLPTPHGEHPLVQYSTGTVKKSFKGANKILNLSVANLRGTDNETTRLSDSTLHRVGKGVRIKQWNVLLSNVQISKCKD